MSWLAKLYETYEAGGGLDLPGDEKLMPISHTLQNAHINIVIDGYGNFRRASVLEKTQVVLPATEKSAGRSSGEAPHPLADKLQYIAKDYAEYGGKKKAYFEGYQKQLGEWCQSKFSLPNAKAVYEYISKGTVIADLVHEGILYVDENNLLRTNWSLDVNNEHPVPTIFKILPKQKDKQTGKSFTDQGSALVCWSVEMEGEPKADTWIDTSLQESWMQFDALNGGVNGLCFVTGEEKPLAVNHPAKLRHTGDKAKLVSANDMSGFTFRGRFTDTKKSISNKGSQSLGISFEVTQKAHNALRWLVSRQGYRNGDQVYVAWAVSGKSIPAPLEDSWSMLGKAVSLQAEVETESENNIDHSRDLGESFAHKFNNYLRGYHTKLEPNEQIVVIGLDSATPGRMGIIYYREFLASEFLQRLEDWHTQFAWPQRHTLEIPSEKKGKKPIRKTIWPESSPVPRSIAEAAYGDILKSNDSLKKNLLERILPCIVDGRPFPRDVMIAAVRRASNRTAYKTDKQWLWEEHLG
ncbi:MAG: type I-C CRISPR-associated protein Cas8c/Csd1, partial [Proteobacteria bacterium]|nr:type I-C CRISPR-associated protein Cas8c/Csd1 [Pseudomonadota bacterium]